jgi:hypothetical protein
MEDYAMNKNAILRMLFLLMIPLCSLRMHGKHGQT